MSKETSYFLVLTFLSATPAFAERHETTVDWSGFYVGVEAGWGEVDGRLAYDSTLQGTFQAGYLHDFGKVVLGAEIDIAEVSSVYWMEEASNIRGDSAKFIFGIKEENFLPYFTAGPARLRFDFDHSQLPPLQYDQIGTALGVGLRYSWNDNFFSGVEVLNYSFPEYSITLVRARTISVSFNYRF